MNKSIVFTLGLFFLSAFAFSQSPVGTWVTIDDETGKAKAHVQITENNGVLQGKIVKLLLKPQNSVCTACKDDKKGKPLVGMTVISGMKKDGNEWSGGKIFKADNGKEYNGSMKMDGKDKLIVTGKVLFITKSQTWTRLK